MSTGRRRRLVQRRHVWRARCCRNPALPWQACMRAPGGKGFNQAVAARALVPGPVSECALGDDAGTTRARSRRCRRHRPARLHSDAPTRTRRHLRRRHGSQFDRDRCWCQCVVVGGLHGQPARPASASRVVLVQMESRLMAIRGTRLRIAHHTATNRAQPAPAMPPRPRTCWRCVDVLDPNETDLPACWYATRTHASMRRQSPAWTRLACTCCAGACCRMERR